MTCAPLPQAPAGLVDAGSGQIAIEMAASRARAVQAMLAAIDVLNLACERLRSSRGALPEGEAKEMLAQEQRRLAFDLYEVRMVALRLISESDNLMPHPLLRSIRQRVA